jgi:hypothetical protein
MNGQSLAHLRRFRRSRYHCSIGESRASHSVDVFPLDVFRGARVSELRFRGDSDPFDWLV